MGGIVAADELPSAFTLHQPEACAFRDCSSSAHVGTKRWNHDLARRRLSVAIVTHLTRRQWFEEPAQMGLSS